MDPATALTIAAISAAVGIVGAVAGIAGAVAGALINQRGAPQTAERTLQDQRQREKLKDARDLRNDRSERLRAFYDKVLVEILHAGTDVGRMGTAVSDEERRRISDEVLFELEVAHARLGLEPDTTRVALLVDRFIEMMRSGQSHDLRDFLAELAQAMNESFAAVEHSVQTVGGIAQRAVAAVGASVAIAGRRKASCSARSARRTAERTRIVDRDVHVPARRRARPTFGPQQFGLVIRAAAGGFW